MRVIRVADPDLPTYFSSANRAHFLFCYKALFFNRSGYSLTGEQWDIFYLGGLILYIGCAIRFLFKVKLSENEAKMFLLRNEVVFFFSLFRIEADHAVKSAKRSEVKQTDVKRKWTNKFKGKGTESEMYRTEGTRRSIKLVLAQNLPHINEQKRLCREQDRLDNEQMRQKIE
jgi:hypothetical protein